METQQAQSDSQRAQWQQAFQGSPITMAHNNDSMSAPSNYPNTTTLSPPLLTSQSGHRYADYTAPKLSPAHVAGTFALAGGGMVNILNSRNNSQSPQFFNNDNGNSNSSNPASGYNSPQFFQQQQQHQQQYREPSQTGQSSPFGNSYSFQSSSSRPPISVMTSNPSTPSYNQQQDPAMSTSQTLSMAMPIPTTSSQSNMMGQSSSFAYLTAGILDPTSMVYDENSGGYATPSYAGSYADDSSFDDRRSHSPFDSRPDSRSPHMGHNRTTSVAPQEPAFASNATDLLAFRETVQQGKSDWDDLSSLGAQDHISNSRSSPSNHLSSPELGAKQMASSFEGHGLEMAVERMFAPLPSPRLVPTKEDTLRATSAPPPNFQALSAPVSARSVFTASPAHSPVLGAQPDQVIINNNNNIAVPQVQRYSPSPTSQGNFMQQQQGQPSLRSPPLPHLTNQSSNGENKNALLAPLAIPDKPDLTLTTATPTAIPRTATARQDSTQAALDTVFSTFFQRPANRNDSKDSTDSGPTNSLHAEAAQALFGNAPPQDLTLDLGSSFRNRAAPMRQRSKSDTYMNSPTTFDGPSFGFSGSGGDMKTDVKSEQQQQPSGAIDPRALDGSSPGWQNFKASAIAMQQQGSALVTDDDQDALTANLPSAAGPSSRRRSQLDTSPYETYDLGGIATNSKHSYLVPPSQGGSSLQRSSSHGSAHKRGAQSEDFTSATFSPRAGQFGDLRTSNLQTQNMKQEHQYTSTQQQQPGNRFLGGGYEPQAYNQSQYDLSNLPPMPSAFMGGQEPQYAMSSSSSAGDYSRQPSVDYGQQSQAGYPGYMPAVGDQYNTRANNGLMPTHYPQYMPPGMNAYNPPELPYNQQGMLYPHTEIEFLRGPDGMLDAGRMRRRSSVRSDTSGISGVSGVSDFTWESKTTEATKQAAKRRRKDPAAAKFVCEYCNETFTRAYNLKGHIRSHEGLKPFTCEVCNKGFARRHDLKRHELLHSGVKKYICEACQQPFVRLDALQRHHKSENGAACIQQIAQMAAAAGVDLSSDGTSAQPSATTGANTFGGSGYSTSGSQSQVANVQA